MSKTPPPPLICRGEDSPLLPISTSPSSPHSYPAAMSVRSPSVAHKGGTPPSSQPNPGVPEPYMSVVFHGFDEFLDDKNDNDSSDVLLYKALHDERLPELWTLAHENGTKGCEIPATNASQGTKRFREDDESTTKAAKRKMYTVIVVARSEQNPVNPNDRKRPVCATKRKLTLADVDGFSQKQSASTHPRAAMVSNSEPISVKQADTMSLASSTSTAATTFASPAATKLALAPSRILSASSKQPVTRKPAPSTTIKPSPAPKATAPKPSTPAKSSTTTKGTTTASPAVKRSSIEEFVGRVPVSEYREPVANDNAKVNKKSKAKPKAKPKAKVNRKLAKSIGAKVSRLEKRVDDSSDSDDGRKPLSKIAQKLTAAQVAARKAAKQ